MSYRRKVLYDLILTDDDLFQAGLDINDIDDDMFELIAEKLTERFIGRFRDDLATVYRSITRDD